MHLLGIRAGSGMGRNKTVSHGVRINFGFIFVKDFEFLDEGIEGFEVVFGDVKLNTRGAKSENLCQFGIYHSIAGFCIVFHLFNENKKYERKNMQNIFRFVQEME